MISSGQNIFVGFAAQNEFSFNCDFSIDSSSGISNIYISGDAGSYKLFSFDNGRLYDYDNNFIRCYSANDSVNISGNFLSGDMGYFINSSPSVLSGNVCSRFLSFDSLLFTTNRAVIDVTVDIFGKTVPTYEFSFPNFSVVTGSKITGYLKNNSTLSYQSFKLFSGSSLFENKSYSLLSNVSGLKINPNQSGRLDFDFSDVDSFQIDDRKQLIPVTGLVSFLSNFGEFSIPVTLPLKASPYYFIDFEADSVYYYGNTGTLSSFKLQRSSCSGSRFEFLFKNNYWPYLNSLFSQSFSITSSSSDDRYFSSPMVYNSSRSCYVGTGYIYDAGCYDNNIFDVKFDVLHFCQGSDILLNNRYTYSLSGIEDKFLFSGILEEIGS